ncbi:MAG: AbrB/MazE/SpoVT family DNA-binding domain-containing protein, partial [Oscillospiraceae bacterium]|nr:AbrB/MazE/SpoVT family DNA-binding domain-containing protein [Oscillospiraceae bacterium]
MKATGIVRRLDDLGRIVLPIELRRTLNLEIKDPVEIFTENDCVILKKFEPTCIFCGSS